MDPVFLVGVPRSGTTLIRLVLDSHPNIYSGPETPWLGGNYLEPNVSLRGLYERFNNCSTSPIRYMSGVDVEFVRGLFSKFVIGLFMHQLTTVGKTRWVEKTPDNIVQVPFLNELFPNAKFIHVIRDGRDVAISTIETGRKSISYFIPNDRICREKTVYTDQPLIQRTNTFKKLKNIKKFFPYKIKFYLESKFPTFTLWKAPRIKEADSNCTYKYYTLINTYFNALWRWKEWISKFEKDVRVLSINSITVTYEDLVSNPKKVFSQIFNFIGESWSDDVLLYKNHVHDLGIDGDRGVNSSFQHSKITSERVGKWEKKLTKREKILTGKYFDEFLRMKGYSKTI